MDIEKLEELQNKDLIAKLPAEGVHCFAANTKQVTTRRIVSTIVFAACVALAVVLFLPKTRNVSLGALAAIAAIIALLVFIQSFLIAKYRVAVDYNQKRIVLRYRYSLITIPFESFDAREGEPDKAEALLDNMDPGARTCYLILDDVFDEACYQTSTKDLATREDFFQLKEECFAIAEAYGARNSDGAIKMNTDLKSKDKIKKGDLSDESVDDVIANALNDVEPAEEKAEEKAEEAAESEEKKEE
ncbi:MAG: hypothetical protein MJ108_10450 [Saccharofermentans sp.]|nr:hypothetical protein [Saccharofermentans sp.]